MLCLDGLWVHLYATYDAYQLTVYGTFALVVTSYWLCGFAFLALDWTRWPALYRFKIQPEVHLDPRMLAGMFRNLLLGQILVMLPAALLLHWLAERGIGVRLVAEPPTTTEAPFNHLSPAVAILAVTIS